MKSRHCFWFAGAVLLLLGLCFSAGVSSGAEVATVNGEVITSEELVMNFRVASTGGDGSVPDTTLEGKKEFLDRVIAKHLLSQHFRAMGWDTLSYWDSLLVDYYRGQYLQALYHHAIPEARVPGSVEVPELMELSKAYVDSLEKAYHLTVDENAVIFIGDRSVVRQMDTAGERSHLDSQPRLVWSELFTDEEKKMPVARLLGGVLTLGEFAEQVDRRPPFARPTGGNTDQIVLTIESLGRDKMFELEFDKLGLRDKPFFRDLARKKREELILSQLFAALQETTTVTQEEVKEHYDTHRDDFMTVPLIKLAVMSFDSVDVARQAAKKLEEGRDFESVAVDFSIYSGTEAGFDTTGYVSKDKAQGLFDSLWEKEIGSTAGPVAEAGHWKIGKLLARLDPRLLSLEEATPMIVERLNFLKADEDFAAMIDGLRSKASIVVNEEALRAVVLPGTN